MLLSQPYKLLIGFHWGVNALPPLDLFRSEVLDEGCLHRCKQPDAVVHLAKFGLQSRFGRGAHTRHGRGTRHFGKCCLLPFSRESEEFHYVPFVVLSKSLKKALALSVLTGSFKELGESAFRTFCHEPGY